MVEAVGSSPQLAAVCASAAAVVAVALQEEGWPNNILVYNLKGENRA